MNVLVTIIVDMIQNECIGNCHREYGTNGCIGNCHREYGISGRMNLLLANVIVNMVPNVGIAVVVNIVSMVVQSRPSTTRLVIRRIGCSAVDRASRFFSRWGEYVEIMVNNVTNFSRQRYM